MSEAGDHEHTTPQRQPRPEGVGRDRGLHARGGHPERRRPRGLRRRDRHDRRPERRRQVDPHEVDLRPGLRRATGSITLHDNEITGLAPHSVTRAGVSYVPQLDNVFPSLTVQENLELGAIAGGEGTVEERMERMFGLFPRLEERRRQAAGTMSGGERQMVAMGRALMPGPEILLLDEPSAGLAPAFVDAVFEKVLEVNAAGVTILMVEQNARRALTLSHRGYVLDLGQNKFTGPGPELVADPKVAELYLGGGAGRVDAEVDEQP